MKDPAFLEEAKKENLDIEAASGAELQTIVEDILATPKPVVQHLAKIIGDPNGTPGL
jgi:hypothetical protein